MVFLPFFLLHLLFNKTKCRAQWKSAVNSSADTFVCKEAGISEVPLPVEQHKGRFFPSSVPQTIQIQVIIYSRVQHPKQEHRSSHSLKSTHSRDKKKENWRHIQFSNLFFRQVIIVNQRGKSDFKFCLHFLYICTFDLYKLHGRKTGNVCLYASEMKRQNLILQLQQDMLAKLRKFPILKFYFPSLFLTKK